MLSLLKSRYFRRMKTFFSLILLLISVSGLMAQNDTAAVYKRFPVIPPFKIIALPDSTFFTEVKLPKNKAVIFILFSPDCDHCRRAFTDLMNNFSLYQNIQIVMTSPIRYDILKFFYEEHQIAGYPNIIMGRDPGAYLNTFFENRSFPGIFIYNKKGKFITEVRDHPDFKKIAELF